MNKLLIYFSNYYANQFIQLKKKIYRKFISIIISLIWDSNVSISESYQLENVVIPSQWYE